ncbi:MAG: lysophospholipid acyltransferase family protein [Actinocatenispora sp.]
MVRRGFWVRFGMGAIRSALTVFSRHTWRGVEHLPRTGGAILVANHISQVDPMVIAHFVYNAGLVPRFLAKAALLDAPLIGRAFRSAGQIPVYRESRDAVRALQDAEAAVRAGEIVVIYPEGTTTRDPDHWPMHGRTGVARLALATGAPVIPIAHWGAQRLEDPVAHKVRLRPRTPVTVVAGPPIDLSRWQRDGAEPGRQDLVEIVDVIMCRIRDMLAEIRGEQPPELYRWPPRRTT